MSLLVVTIQTGASSPPTEPPTTFSIGTDYAVIVVK